MARHDECRTSFLLRTCMHPQHQAQPTLGASESLTKMKNLQIMMIKSQCTFGFPSNAQQNPEELLYRLFNLFPGLLREFERIEAAIFTRAKCGTPREVEVLCRTKNSLADLFDAR